MNKFQALISSSVVTLALLTSSIAQAEQQTAILKTSGAVSIKRGATSLTATPGTVLQLGDIIETGSSGFAQWQIPDQALFALGSRSAFRMDAFNATAQPQTAAQRSVFSLIKGGVRIVTDANPTQSKHAYTVNTPVATINDLSSDASLVYCNNDCNSIAATTPSAFRKISWLRAPAYGRLIKVASLSGQTLVQNGLYVHLLAGNVVLNNLGGELTLAAGQYAFVNNSLALASVVAQTPLTTIHLFEQLSLDFSHGLVRGLWNSIPQIEIQPPASPS